MLGGCIALGGCIIFFELSPLPSLAHHNAVHRSLYSFATTANWHTDAPAQVKTLDGKTYTYTVQPTTTVAELKAMVAKDTGIAANAQRIIFRGKVSECECERDREFPPPLPAVPVFTLPVPATSAHVCSSLSISLFPSLRHQQENKPFCSACAGAERCSDTEPDQGGPRWRLCGARGITPS